ncbi:tRNA U34 carboxymethyltransferase [Anaerolineae bacterium]|nr:tRNA U34 carboxymethyltransferase [Anaerolineae bacterium]
MNINELKAEVAKINWWHTIDLGQGIVTPGKGDSAMWLKRLAFPSDLSGKTFLDIGAWDGYFSFAAEQRGARRVLALDSFVWQGNGGGSKAGFELARRALNSKVEDIELEVLEISPDRIGTFDVVLFSGVLYHMRHPLLALEKVCSVTSDMLILETHVDLMSAKWPAMRFYPAGELAGDGSNWWGPNPIAVETMLEVVGFRTIKTIGLYPMDNEQGRLVMHAWR